MPVAGYKTAGSAMYSRTELPMSGSAGWKAIGNIRNLRNAPNVSCWHGAGDVPPWQVEKTEISMRRIRSAGRRRENKYDNLFL